MSYRSVDHVPADTPAFEGILEAVLLQALDIAREKAEAGEDIVPFTALAVGETLFTETHPAEDPDDCFKQAQHTVQNARGAAAYAFCYDGYVDTDKGEIDAIIAEGGIPGSHEGHAIGYLYTIEETDQGMTLNMEERPIYIGQAPNFMEYTLIVDDLASEDEQDEDLGDTLDSDGIDLEADEENSPDFTEPAETADVAETNNEDEDDLEDDARSKED